ncbi:MAG: hypothetical protein M3Q92_13855 [Actinomycetota bacterium]|nr:hypothetical protein [Actinomycetota bacterium]
MTAGGDPGRPVHIPSDVTLLRYVRRARMDPHPHPDRAGRQPLQRVSDRPQRARRRGKGDKEGVPLRVHLDAAVAGEGIAQDPAMLRERRRIDLRAKLVQQLR